jgi:hypothetical protein
MSTARQLCPLWLPSSAPVTIAPEQRKRDSVVNALRRLDSERPFDFYQCVSRIDRQSSSVIKRSPMAPCSPGSTWSPREEFMFRKCKIPVLVLRC